MDSNNIFNGTEENSTGENTAVESKLNNSISDNASYTSTYYTQNPYASAYDAQNPYVSSYSPQDSYTSSYGTQNVPDSVVSETQGPKRPYQSFLEAQNNPNISNTNYAYGNNSNAAAANYYTGNYTYNGQNTAYQGYQPEMEEPVKMGEWILLLCLTTFIPIVGWILAIVWAFSKTESKSKVN